MEKTEPVLLLERDEVHVWRAALDRLTHCFSRLHALLSSDEQARCGRYFREHDRIQFGLTRGILRLLLSRYCGVPASAIALDYSAQGKPALAGCRELQFNLSHSGGMAVFALALSRRVGIDVERMRAVQDRDLLVSRNFAPEEVEAYHKLPTEARPQGFFNGWTRKEAFVKALGQGLSHPLSAFAVSLTPGEPARLLRVDSGSADGWMLCDLTEESSYVAALAIEGTGLRIRSHQWSDCTVP